MLFGLRNDLHPFPEKLRIVSILGSYAKKEHPVRGVLFWYLFRIEQMKYGADERRRRGLDRAEH